MHVIRNTEEIRKFIGEKKTAVALGAFDGLHSHGGGKRTHTRCFHVSG